MTSESLASTCPRLNEEGEEKETNITTEQPVALLQACSNKTEVPTPAAKETQEENPTITRSTGPPPLSVNSFLTSPNSSESLSLEFEWFVWAAILP